MLQQFSDEFLTAPEFVSRAFAAVKSLDEDEYFMRTPVGSKQVIEEVWPLAVLLLHLWVPCRELSCKFTGLTEGHDAELTISGPDVQRGFLKPHYFVEVTTAAHEDEHLRRESLARNGAVHLGPISRKRAPGVKRGEIVSESEAVDGDAWIDETAGWVRKRVAEKAAKDYPSPSWLLVNVESPHPRLSREPCRLQSAVAGVTEGTPFSLVHVIACSTNTVLRI